MNHSAFAVIFNSTLSTLSHSVQTKITIYLNPIFVLSFHLLLVFCFLSKFLKGTRSLFSISAHLHVPLPIFGTCPLEHDFTNLISILVTLLQ